MEVDILAVAEAGLPVWTMKVGMERWNGESSYADEAQRARKFYKDSANLGVESSVRLTSAVLGTDSQKTSILMSPTLVCNVTDMASGQGIH